MRKCSLSVNRQLDLVVVIDVANYLESEQHTPCSDHLNPEVKWHEYQRKETKKDQSTYICEIVPLTVWISRWTERWHDYSWESISILQVLRSGYGLKELALNHFNLEVVFVIEGRHQLWIGEVQLQLDTGVCERFHLP